MSLSARAWRRAEDPLCGCARSWIGATGVYGRGRGSAIRRNTLRPAVFFAGVVAIA
jgi:hypothetical protein